jgi:GxxExxY protein
MNKPLHSELTSIILNSCFEVINELGAGFLESVYKNALIVSLQEKGIFVETEKVYEIYFKGKRVGYYKADIVVENCVIVELKCCKILAPENIAQTINYLKASNLLVALLVNFGNKKLEYKRLHHPTIYPEIEVKTPYGNLRNTKLQDA